MAISEVQGKRSSLIQSKSVPESSAPKQDGGTGVSRGRTISFDKGVSGSRSSQPLPQPKQVDRRPLSDHNVQMGKPGQYGLKHFQSDKGPIAPFGLRYDKATHGDLQVGDYRVVADKSRGVEPGFVGRKAWTDADTDKLSKPGHKFSVKADSFLDQRLNPLSGNFKIRKAAEEFLISKGDTGFKKGKDDVYHFINARPELRRETLDHLKTEPPIQNALKEHVMQTEDKFNRNHYVKLDYREAQGKGEGEARTYTLPKSNAKDFGFGAIGKFFHQLARRQTPDAINRDAMREGLANDLMRSFGIFTQKLKIIPTTYDQGLGKNNPPKLLLDGTHMVGPKGEKFRDFEGAIKGKLPNGQLVKLDPDTGKPVKNTRGHYEVDTSIKEMGRNKIFMLLLGDRDAIGSKGGNKGRVGDTFAAIDPGHSLELGGQNLMGRKDIRSDMSFVQPSWLASKCYKNFSIFDQSPFSERMEGVRQLREQARNGTDLEVFEDYASTFGKDASPGLDFSEQIGAMKKAYIERRDYILNNVFAERLGVYDYDFSGVGDVGAQQEAPKQVLDVLDTLEKITSKHTWRSGDIELAVPIVTDRTAWNVKESGGSIEFSVDNPSRSVRSRLENFINDSGIDRGNYTIDTSGGRLVVRVAKSEIGTAFADFSLTKLKAHDEAPTPEL